MDYTKHQRSVDSQSSADMVDRNVESTVDTVHPSTATTTTTENNRIVYTASMHQVRHNIYLKSIGKWRRYQKYLQSHIQREWLKHIPYLTSINAIFSTQTLVSVANQDHQDISDTNYKGYMKRYVYLHNDMYVIVMCIVYVYSDVFLVILCV